MPRFLFSSMIFFTYEKQNAASIWWRCCVLLAGTSSEYN